MRSPLVLRVCEYVDDVTTDECNNSLHRVIEFDSSGVWAAQHMKQQQEQQQCRCTWDSHNSLTPTPNRSYRPKQQIRSCEQSLRHQPREQGKKKRSWLRTFLLLYVLWWVTILYLHVPLPDSVSDRHKMTVVDHVMRWIYRYPLVNLHVLGAYAQVYYQRYTLKGLGWLIAPWRAHAQLDITDVMVQNVPVRVYVPHSRSPNDGAVVFIHGGGFAIGDIVMYDSVARELASRTQLVTLSIDYRLSPEHAFPAGLNDAQAVVFELLGGGWAQQLQIDPSRVVIMGDSAGGNLATVVARKVRDAEHLPNLMAQVLLYPLVQFHDFQLPSYQQYYNVYPDTAFVDPHSIARSLLFYSGVHASDRHLYAMLNNSHVSWSGAQLSHHLLPDAFVGDTAVRMHVPNEHLDYEVAAELHPFLFNPDISPLLADNLSGLPRAFVLTCEFDVLRDEGYLYAEHLRSQGVSVTHQHYAGGFHAMLNLHDDITEAARMLYDAIHYINHVMDNAL